MSVEEGQVGCPRQGLVDIERCWACRAYDGLSTGYSEGVVCRSSISETFVARSVDQADTRYLDWLAEDPPAGGSDPVHGRRMSSPEVDWPTRQARTPGGGQPRRLDPTASAHLGQVPRVTLNVVAWHDGVPPRVGAGPHASEPQGLRAAHQRLAGPGRPMREDMESERQAASHRKAGLKPFTKGCLALVRQPGDRDVGDERLNAEGGARRTAWHPH